MSTFDRATHEIHTRRWGRNLGLGIVLVSFVAVIFGLTVAKVSTGASLEAFDHVVRPSLMEAN